MITSFQLPDGQQTPLSNFWFGQPLNFDLRPISDVNVWPTAEHLFQACKAVAHRDVERVHATRTPGEAKRLGQTIPLRPDWEAIKLSTMRDILRSKFSSPTSYEHQFLLSTGNSLLIEGNRWGDRFWGQSPVGRGQNWLGFLLMGVRAELRGLR